MFDCDLALRARTATIWEVTEDLTWTGTRGDTFVVEAGFLTDLASVPRALHWLVLPYGAYTRAAVLHDWLLAQLAIWGKADPATRGSLPVTSRDIDGIFRRVMHDLGVGWAKRWTMWSAVRLGALLNRQRAPGRGFWRDAPRVFGMGLLVAPVVLPGLVGVLLSLGLIRLITWRFPPRRGPRNAPRAWFCGRCGRPADEDGCLHQRQHGAC